MLGKPGPFQIIESEGCGNVDAPIAAPRRRHGCQCYDTCLDLAAALNWDNFTCRGCSGSIDSSLFWRARQAQKKDAVVKTLCDFPLHRIQPEVSVESADPRPSAEGDVTPPPSAEKNPAVLLFRSRK